MYDCNICKACLRSAARINRKHSTGYVPGLVVEEELDGVSYIVDIG